MPKLDGSTITLNVIYLRGTARALSLGALSLAHYSPFDLRLVSNGCSEDEEQFLEHLCSTHPKLSFLHLPVEAVRKMKKKHETLAASGTAEELPTMARHSEALDHLQSLESSAFFGFIDSDIFAVEKFATDVDFQQPGIFSAQPVTTAWTHRKEQFEAAKNTFGSSFVSIYPNDLLSKVREEIDLGFEIYRWKRVPEALRERIESAGAARKRFDMGRLLNTVLTLEGHSIVWLDDKNLRHLGGYSHPSPPVPKPESLLAFPGYLVQKGMRYAKDYRRVGFFLEQSRFYRTACAAHFVDVLEALDQRKPLPALPHLKDSYVRQKLQQTSLELKELHDLLKRDR